MLSNSFPKSRLFSDEYDSAPCAVRWRLESVANVVCPPPIYRAAVRLLGLCQRMEWAFSGTRFNKARLAWGGSDTHDQLNPLVNDADQGHSGASGGNNQIGCQGINTTIGFKRNRFSSSFVHPGALRVLELKPPSPSIQRLR
jgi:hypothetical protein